MSIRTIPRILLLIALLTPGVAPLYADDDDVYHLPPYISKIANKLVTPRADKALIYFVQSDSSHGLPHPLITPRQMWVFSDKQLLALMPTSTISYAYVDPGERLFWVSHKSKVNAVTALRRNVKAGKTYFFQIASVRTKTALLWVLDPQDLKATVKQMLNIQVVHGHKKIKKDSERIITREYRHANKVARSYPTSMVGSPAYTYSGRYDYYKEKKNTFHFASSNKKQAKTKSEKALVYMMGPPHYNKGITVKQNSIWTFANDKLLGIIYLNDYTFAWVDPGEYLFWGVNYLRPGTKDFSISAIRMNVEAGKTYYLEQNISTEGMSAMGLKMRVVEPAAGVKIVQRMKYFSVPTKKGLNKKAKIIKRFYDSAKRVKASYPATRFGRYVPKPLPNIEDE